MPHSDPTGLTLAQYYAANPPTGHRAKQIGVDPPGNLVVIFGDSIGMGTADPDQFDRGMALTTAYPSVQHNVKIANSPIDPPSWTTITTEDLQPWGPGGGLGAGIELTFGREMFNAGYELTIGKMAIAGSTLNDHWKPSATYPTGTNLYAQLVAYIQALETEVGEDLGGVVISLGSNDAADAADAAAFGANLTALAAALRTTWPLLKIALLNMSASATPTHTATIRSALASYVSGDSNAVLVNTDDFPLTDGIHYTANGYASLGQAAAFALFDLLGLTRPTVSTAHPQIMGNGVAAYGSGALAPLSWPGQQDGDREYLFVGTASADVAIALSSAQGFVEEGTQARSDFVSAVFQRGAIFSRPVTSASLVNGRMPAPTVQDTNAFLVARTWTVRGPTGAPATNGIARSSNNTNGTNLTMTGVTTTADNCLIAMFAVGFGPRSVSVVNAGLTSVAEHIDGYHLIGSDYQMLSLTTGVKATAGATGNATLTASGDAVLAGQTVAIEP
jgi:hypothetical protein